MNRKQSITSLKDVEKLLSRQTVIILNAVDQKLKRVDKRFDKVDQKFDAILQAMYKGFENVDKRFERVDKRFIGVYEEFKEAREERKVLGVKIDNTYNLLDGYIKSTEDIRDEFEIMKNEMNRVKEVIKEKLGVEISVT